MSDVSRALAGAPDKQADFVDTCYLGATGAKRNFPHKDETTNNVVRNVE